jgi:hypothetical protein
MEYYHPPSRSFNFDLNVLSFVLATKERTKEKCKEKPIAPLVFPGPRLSKVTL